MNGHPGFGGDPVVALAGGAAQGMVLGEDERQRRLQQAYALALQEAAQRRLERGEKRADDEFAYRRTQDTIAAAEAAAKREREEREKEAKITAVMQSLGVDRPTAESIVLTDVDPQARKIDQEKLGLERRRVELDAASGGRAAASEGRARTEAEEKRRESEASVHASELLGYTGGDPQKAVQLVDDLPVDEDMRSRIRGKLGTSLELRTRPRSGIQIQLPRTGEQVDDGS